MVAIIVFTMMIVNFCEIYKVIFSNKRNQINQAATIYSMFKRVIKGLVFICARKNKGHRPEKVNKKC